MKPTAERKGETVEEFKLRIAAIIGDKREHIAGARLPHPLLVRVIIRAGEGENLLWELKQAVETLNPQKLLILVLDMKAKEYESFRTNVNPVFSVSLPKGPVRGFIGFGADWKPSFSPLQIPSGFFKGKNSFIDQLKFALRPVFESFGLEWQPPLGCEPMPRIIQKLVESGTARVLKVGGTALFVAGMALLLLWEYRYDIQKLIETVRTFFH